jgi:hypothetical protein
MITFTAKGETFQFPERFFPGHLPSPGESSAINRYIMVSLRAEILAGNIKTRQEAYEYIMGDECLAPRTNKSQPGTDDLELLEGL